MTIEELRQKFLEEAATVIMQEYIEILCGKRQDYSCASLSTVTQAINVIQDMMLKASDRKDIGLLTTAEIVKTVQKGKMSAETGLKYMELLQAQQNIDELPKLLEEINKLSETK